MGRQGETETGRCGRDAAGTWPVRGRVWPRGRALATPYERTRSWLVSQHLDLDAVVGGVDHLDATGRVLSSMCTAASTHRAPRALTPTITGGVRMYTHRSILLLDDVHTVAVPVGTASGEMGVVGPLTLLGTCWAARGERYARTGAAFVMHVKP